MTSSRPPASLRPARTARSSLVVVLLAALVATAGCTAGRGQVGATGDVRWRDLSMLLPDGWVVTQDTASAFSVNDKPLPDDPDAYAPGGDGDVALLPEAGAYFTHAPDETIQDWRDLVARQGGTVHRDETFTVDGVPANLLEFSQSTGDVPTRERVVVIPARDIVVLLQPIPARAFGEGVGPGLFAAHEQEFTDLVASFDLGAPQR